MKTFDWFDWCYYCNHKSFSYPQKQVGCVLGPVKNDDNEMAQWVLKDTMKIVP